MTHVDATCLQLMRRSHAHAHQRLGAVVTCAQKKARGRPAKVSEPQSKRGRRGGTGAKPAPKRLRTIVESEQEAHVTSASGGGSGDSAEACPETHKQAQGENRVPFASTRASAPSTSRRLPDRAAPLSAPSSDPRAALLAVAEVTSRVDAASTAAAAFKPSSSKPAAVAEGDAVASVASTPERAPHGPAATARVPATQSDDDVIVGTAGHVVGSPLPLAAAAAASAPADRPKAGSLAVPASDAGRGRAVRPPRRAADVSAAVTQLLNYLASPTAPLGAALGVRGRHSTPAGERANARPSSARRDGTAVVGVPSGKEGSAVAHFLPCAKVRQAVICLAQLHLQRGGAHCADATGTNSKHRRMLHHIIMSVHVLLMLVVLQQ
jgi:hypothetical protein